MRILEICSVLERIFHYRSTLQSLQKQNTLQETRKRGVREKQRSFLFNDVFSCCNYIESQRDEKYNSMENECSDIDSGETANSQRIRSYCTLATTEPTRTGLVSKQRWRHCYEYRIDDTRTDSINDQPSHFDFGKKIRVRISFRRMTVFFYALRGIINVYTDCKETVSTPQ